MPAARPILVTGSHRSGTGWLGDMLLAAPSPRLGLVWEPFNLSVSRGIRDAPFHDWFTYLTAENDGAFREPLADALSFRYRTAPAIRSVRSVRDAGRVVVQRRRMRSLRRSTDAALCKDPIAVFSAPWLADTFDMSVVISIRHPAAMVASVMRLGWMHPFGHFLRQPDLMRDLLPHHADTIERFAADPPPIIDQASFLWLMIYERVLAYRSRYPEWFYVRHEDLSTDPLGRMKELYAGLDLEWSPRVEDEIRSLTGPQNPIEIHDPSNHRRDSRAAIGRWKHRLTPREQERIRSWTEPVASAFYDDAEW